MAHLSVNYLTGASIANYAQICSPVTACDIAACTTPPPPYDNPPPRPPAIAYPLPSPMDAQQKALPATEPWDVLTEAAMKASPAPMEIPTSAAASAGRSLTPSPQKTVVLPSPCKDNTQHSSETTCNFCLGPARTTYSVALNPNVTFGTALCRITCCRALKLHVVSMCFCKALQSGMPWRLETRCGIAEPLQSNMQQSCGTKCGIPAKHSAQDTQAKTLREQALKCERIQMCTACKQLTSALLFNRPNGMIIAVPCLLLTAVPDFAYCINCGNT